ncbi:MAG: GNAT family N-acetyltransferase [Enterococcus casseliflavus]
MPRCITSVILTPCGSKHPSGGKGYGKQILTALEQQLKAFGCENCQTATFDFQAPDFYQRLGYDEIGRIAHTQNQLTEIFLVKKLHD